MGEEDTNQMAFLDSLVVSVFPASSGITTHQSAPQCQAHHGEHTASQPSVPSSCLIFSNIYCDPEGPLSSVDFYFSFSH